MAIKKGICKNFGECDLADERKIQEVDSADFVCEECGKPLTECANPQTKGPGNNKAVKIAIGSIAGLAVIGGIVYAVSTLSSNSEDDEKGPITAENITLSKSENNLETGSNDTLEAKVSPLGATYSLKWASSDTTIVKVKNGIVTAVSPGKAKIGVQIQENKQLKAFCDYTVTEPKTEPEDTEKKNKKTTSKPKPANGAVTDMPVANGKYTGAVKNGKPHGLGTLVFTKTAVINNSDPKLRTAQAGESVQGQFVNGTFTIGKHFDASGNLIESLNFGVAN